MTEHPLGKWLNLRMGRAPDLQPVSIRELQEWQFDSLRRTLFQAVKNCPFYHERLAGMQTGAVHSPADLAKLPFTTADDLRANPDSFLCVSQDEIARAVTLASSGSSGPPKRLFFTAGDLERTIDFFHYGMAPMLKEGETILAILPDSRPGGVGSLFAESISRLGGETVLPVNPSYISTLLNLLLDNHASCILGPAIQIHALARLLESKNIVINHVRSVLLCWDVLPQASMQTISRVFGCEVFSHWGMTETCLGGGVDCHGGSGMHLREPDFYVEIINPATEEPIPDGHKGEIVISTLSRRAMPLIRYRTGDVGCIMPDECSCGLPLRRLGAVEGRLGDGIILPGGSRLDLNELNNVILPHKAVLDFTVEYQPETMQLSLKLDVLPDTKPGPEIKKQLLSYHKIKQACDNHNLNLSVRLANQDGTIHSGFGKRSITIKPLQAGTL
ncbi:DVU_1553 family AMP-dependent CoA ligase [Desulfovibrio sp. JC010]|uniref:DVU_1553 family AMP-dependent CoA ligase n=1 Tax=Desulfovibrio sp. JC010 TaxID=2593641 RepID=UPI0013CF96C9|nr:AMP-binding protein [Desulfovibrio sp. JC010]NDV25938.1 phenylacetate--CoA ligase family protein [Desulfovibrio sp. JC010]